MVRDKLDVMNETKHTSDEAKSLVGSSSANLTVKGDDLPESHAETASHYIEEIHNRADAMTPLLKEILEFRP
jgi:hypothetical protein